MLQHITIFHWFTYFDNSVIISALPHTPWDLVPSCGLPFHSASLLWQPIGQPGNAAISPADHSLLNVLSCLIINCTDDIKDVQRVATNQISPYWSQLTHDFWLLWVTVLCTSPLLGPVSFFICSASSLQQEGRSGKDFIIPIHGNWQQILHKHSDQMLQDNIWSRDWCVLGFGMML